MSDQETGPSQQPAPQPRQPVSRRLPAGGLSQMGVPAAGLELKLNLSLLIFLFVLGGLTAAIILFGFNRSQTNATARSQEGLEALGQRQMLIIAQDQSSFGRAYMEYASEIGQQSARYMTEYATRLAPAGATTLSTGDEGQLYDADPNRLTDVFVPNYLSLSPEVERDVRESAVLDVLFPVMMASYPGGQRADSFNAVAIYYMSVNGTTRYYPPIGLADLVPANQRLTEGHLEAGPTKNPERKTIWSAPYLDDAKQGLLITASTPVYSGNEYRGRIGVDLSIAKLIDVVNNVKPTEQGFAFYVDRKGDLLPSNSYSLLTKELSQQNQTLTDTLEHMKGGKIGVERLSLAGEEVFVAYAPIVEVGGSFAVVAPISELTSQATTITSSIEDAGNDTLIVTLVAMGALFVVGLALATWLNRRLLLRPIEALVAGTRRVAAGDLNTTLQVSGEDEMAVLARSFNRMTSELRNRSIALEREVLERRQAQDELRALFAAMTDYVVVIDKDGRYLRVQQTNTPDILMPLQEMTGKTMEEVMPPGQSEAFMVPIREALATQETRSVEYPLEVDGATYWFSSAISPISAEAAVIVARDITERVRAQQELEQRVEERTRELQTVLDISKNVASTLELRPLLQLIIDQLRNIVDYNRSSVLLMEGNTLVLLDSRAVADPQAITLRVQLDQVSALWDQITAGQVVIIDDVRGDSEEAAAYRRATASLPPVVLQDIRGWMGVPLALKDRLIGLLTLSHTETGFYNQHHANLVSAIANQAAVAIENARLYEQAQQLAAVEERSRLARELHDSVSQALYGIALGARTARTLLDRDPTRAVQPVDYVLQLAEAGLAEMRALIFELRPESLELEGLVAALDKQIAATGARYGIKMQSDLGEEPDLPIAEKEALYRVGQEALHNMIKHARATEASVRLHRSNGDIALEVTDNGVGFDPGQGFPGHIGLISMKERAGSIGARLEIDSEPGKGTTVRVLKAVAT